MKYTKDQLVRFIDKNVKIQFKNGHTQTGIFWIAEAYGILEKGNGHYICLTTDRSIKNKIPGIPQKIGTLS